MEISVEVVGASINGWPKRLKSRNVLRLLEAPKQNANRLIRQPSIDCMNNDKVYGGMPSPKYGRRSSHVAS
ncbi:hypothetical protein TNCV_449021 [Trichonephila clavipes]|nr:hypothetical protein TNCV_449021 [Trichonephila clavipes]